MNDYMKLIINAIKAWIPVKSVNGKTGDIVLSASDVGAQPEGNYALEENVPEFGTSTVGQIAEISTVDDSGKPTKISGVNFPQSDWSIQEEGSLNYIKNKTHYHYQQYVEIASTTDSVTSFIQNDLSLSYVNGKSFIDDWGATGTCIDGNVHFDDGGTLMFMWDGDIIVAATYTGGTDDSHESENYFYMIEDEILQLDEKFIPNTIARTTDIEQLTESVADKVSKSGDSMTGPLLVEDTEFGDKTTISTMSISNEYDLGDGELRSFNATASGYKVGKGGTFVRYGKSSDYTYAVIDNGQSTSSSSYALVPVSAADPVRDTDLATKQYVDGAIATKISAPLSAQVDDILCVSAVDENGKPTEWKIIDPWVITSSTEGSTKQFKLTIDDEGVLIATEIVESET